MFEAFRFHMTLTDALPDAERDAWQARLARAYAETGPEPLSHDAPRPKVRWHPLGAVLADDAQIAASGITTVFDRLRAGSDPDGSGRGSELERLAEAVATARAGGLFRAEHRTHLGCELPATDVLDTVAAFCARYPVGLISLMDHTPGQRRFRDLEKYYTYATRGGRPPEEITLPAALATVTANPARATGLADRGALAPGPRADLVRVRLAEGLPGVREVWRAGARVA